MSKFFSRIVSFLFFLFIILLINNLVFAQDFKPQEKKNNKNISDKIFFGGNLSLQFSKIETNIIIEPTIGYRITPKVSAGVGITYSYYKNNNFDITSTIYGGNIFSQADIIKGLFVHGEVELLNIETFTADTLGRLESRRSWVPGIYLGGGYKQQIGERAYLYVMILYNINQSEKSPYENPLIKFGFQF